MWLFALGHSCFHLIGESCETCMSGRHFRVRTSYRYGSNGSGTAFFVDLLSRPGAASSTRSTRGTRLASAMSKASPPFSMKHASSITTMVGCSLLILLGSLPGSATISPPSLSSNCLYDWRSRGRLSG